MSTYVQICPNIRIIRSRRSFIHGILDNASVRNALAKGFNKQCNTHFNYAAFKEEQYDRLANLVRAHIDMKQIYNQLTINECD